MTQVNNMGRTCPQTTDRFQGVERSTVDQSRALPPSPLPCFRLCWEIFICVFIVKSEGAFLNGRVNLPLVAGESSHGVFLGRWDLTSEAADVRARLRECGTVYRQCARKPERGSPDPAGV